MYARLRVRIGAGIVKKAEKKQERENMGEGGEVRKKQKQKNKQTVNRTLILSGVCIFFYLTAPLA
jgi:hypothetical protein